MSTKMWVIVVMFVTKHPADGLKILGNLVQFVPNIPDSTQQKNDSKDF